VERTRTSSGGLARAIVDAEAQFLGTWLSHAQAARVGSTLSDFERFCRRGHGITEPNEVTVAIAAQFVSAGDRYGGAPTTSLQHFRRSALRLLYRAPRCSGAAVGDPTLDLQLPPRSPLSTRPLTDEEVLLCRAASSWSLNDTRRAAAWACAEATGRSVELGHVTRADVDLDRARVWLHGGPKTAKRWGALSDWGCSQLERRLGGLSAEPTTPVLYEGVGTADVGQISSCIALRDVLVRSGLGREPGVRPASVAAWAGKRLLEETGRIDLVAARLGMGSLDRAARFIGWSWGAEERT
jgi:integrase/recombinase XerC